uniref:Uncharacterized protein n=1 Tax=Arundo donax TaxID=35708 RepID=A0A0A9G0R7_ARUDO
MPPPQHLYIGNFANKYQNGPQYHLIQMHFWVDPSKYWLKLRHW